MGDFAGLRMLLDDWRRTHPNEHVTVTYGNHHWRSVYGSQLDIPWVFRDVADVVLEMEHEKDLIHNPVAMDGKPILGRVLSCHIWNDWLRLRNEVIAGRVKLKTHCPDPDVMAKMRGMLDKKGVPEKFITIHPLFDAGYNKYRNGKIEWWNQLIVAMTKVAPVVVIGTHGYLKNIVTPPGAFQLFDLGLSAMLSMAAIAQGQLHVGGETGLTLWAGVCGVPVLAAYGRWDSRRDKGRKLADFRPIPFSKPVVLAPLNSSVHTIAQSAASMLNAPPPVFSHVPVRAPSVAAVAPPKPTAKRIVRAPRVRSPVRSPKRPRKTIKQLLAERHARRQ